MIGVRRMRGLSTFRLLVTATAAPAIPKMRTTTRTTTRPRESAAVAAVRCGIFFSFWRLRSDQSRGLSLPEGPESVGVIIVQTLARRRSKGGRARKRRRRVGIGAEATTSRALAPPRVGDRVMGVTRFGGYAEMVTVDARVVMPLPDGWSFAEGAAYVSLGRFSVVCGG